MLKQFFTKANAVITAMAFVLILFFSSSDANAQWHPSHKDLPGIVENGGDYLVAAVVILAVIVIIAVVSAADENLQPEDDGGEHALLLPARLPLSSNYYTATDDSLSYPFLPAHEKTSLSMYLGMKNFVPRDTKLQHYDDGLPNRAVVVGLALSF